MTTFLKYFEKAIVVTLILLTAVIIVVATLYLCISLVQYFFEAPRFMMDPDQLLDVLGSVLLILIGIELLETIKAYLSEHIIHVEVVLEVALIAVARKVILLDYKEYSAATVFAIAAIILALSIGFFLEKRGRMHDDKAI